jgi:hypothetical protein
MGAGMLIPRTAFTAMAMPMIFIVLVILFQWMFWIIGDIYDTVSPYVGPRGYDPKEIGFFQQLVRDLVPPGAAMLGTGWASSNFLPEGRTVYRIGSGAILVIIVAMAVFVT